ncbi:diguanylate cyclase [Paenibacillus baekrokdamisoli]|uniref:Diguanylate cyclase n=1 Tax=Paenibacillus baekrokdamisoli TaxID=1712516 RepID=A0A3G9J7F5_9BACL|nr:dipeptidase [Paenibacillus baekrokdamisoli]MBB3069853.1 membrane dipeptidase [Paenibacillus baekrokdamisoli]BBH20793.1 diguanylate cyclase [Paenibacillus baekrokdamisoli]
MGMKAMQTTDFHCDVLWKLLENKQLSFVNDTSNKLDVTLPRLMDARSVLQTFAIYIPDEMEKSMVPILQSIDLFNRKVLTAPGVTFVRTSQDAAKLIHRGSIGAMLSLEGADGLQGDPAMLRILYKLGVRAIGLTWNHANWAADGVLEPRQGGLTKKGMAIVEECNSLDILVDVSHLCEQSFWDVVNKSTKPLLASHSNMRSVCNHPRNLTDDQARAMIAMDGLIGLTFVPQFVSSGGAATIDDVLKHVEHLCELGGKDHLMFGSDFDGIDNHVIGLSHPGEVNNLMEALLQGYPEQQVKAFFVDNTIGFLTKHLPKE